MVAELSQAVSVRAGAFSRSTDRGDRWSKASCGAVGRPASAAALEALESRRLLAGDHADILALVPEAEATAQVVASGEWSNPKTWAHRHVPEEGERILIPDGYVITYDLPSSPAFYTLRIDGELHFATDASSAMLVDTVVVSDSGLLSIGTMESPVIPSETARLVFTTSQAIDTDWDPMQLSRGLLSLGSVQIHGAPKTAFLQTALDPGQGATAVTLEQAPIGWEAGDRVVVTGATYDHGFGSRDEVRTLAAAASGSKIHLDSGLSHSHALADEDIPIAVGNYSRNVVIESEGASDVPPERRGHIMFAQGHAAGEVSVQYAEINRLGRTRKDVPIDDPGGKNVDGTPGTGANPRGRYSLHLHGRDTGMDGMGSMEEMPDVIRGNSVSDSPGWGIVSHASHAEISGNVTYGILGSHFATEDGAERGSFTGNLAVYSPKSSHYRYIKDDASVANFDLGFSGHGFWFQGRNLVVKDNFASGMEGDAYAWFHRYPLKNHREGLVIRQHTPLERLVTPHRDLIAKGRTSFPSSEVPITDFDNNIATTSHTGMTIIKRDAKQYHDLRSTFHGFEAWSVRRGIKLEYTGKYTFTDLRLHGDRSSFSQYEANDAGVIIDMGTVDTVFNRMLITGFEEGVLFDDATVPYERVGAVFIDTVIHTRNGDDPADHYTLRRSGENPAADASGFLIMDESQLVYDLGLIPSPEQRYTLPSNLHDAEAGSFLLEGTKLDSVSESRFGEQIHENSDPNLLYREVWRGSHLRNILAEGTELDADGTRYVWLETAVVDRVTSQVIPHRFKARIDTVSPSAEAGVFLYQTMQGIEIRFSEDVAQSLSPSDLVVTNLSTGQIIPGSRFVLEIEGGPEVPTTAVWRYDIATHGTLPDGEYRATLPAGNTTDAAGNRLTANFALEFHVLAGDADRDRDVDFFDFLTLRSNYGQSGKTFGDGDFDYDGDVDFFDFLILRGNYNGKVTLKGNL